MRDHTLQCTILVTTLVLAVTTNAGGPYAQVVAQATKAEAPNIVVEPSPSPEGARSKQPHNAAAGSRTQSGFCDSNHEILVVKKR